MADEGQLRLLKTGVPVWNDWRIRNAHIRPDLRAADLRGRNLGGANLGDVNLSWADLSGANLREADLSYANLNEAHLIRADLTALLIGTNLSDAYLDGADLREADLLGTHLIGTHLDGAELESVCFSGTNFLNVDLSRCKNLHLANHRGPSSVDFGTLQLSGPLPLVFLRGVGLPDNLINYLPSLLASSIQLYSCFISYSSKDDDFAHRLHADLQAKGVRCWFAPHDLPIGAKTRDTIDEAIRLRDKLLLILSRASIDSDWVEDEVTTAFAEERRRGKVVLFPIRVDNAVLTTREAWASKLRDNRNIGDFRRWKDHDAYQKALERVLRDLRIESA
jgi:uncharacterized protein YjbI with pentapeptide repeats